MDKLLQTIQSHANPEKAKILQRFFKTGKGEYAEGDIFLGLVVPIQRKISKQFSNITLNDVSKLLFSPIHEYRLIALFILIEQFKRGDEAVKKSIFELYMNNTQHINNWDLIDLSAPTIVGEYLKNKHYTTLYVFAQSNNLWKKRIAMLSSFTDIKNGRFDRALEIAEILVYDAHDLIHTAVGWMLREMGKRGGLKEEEMFLNKHGATMPRTMLRYAIERFPESKRQFYLNLKNKWGNSKQYARAPDLSAREILG
ncbi:MAG: DNA alkylation repair protein [Bacillota bacterium]